MVRSLIFVALIAGANIQVLQAAQPAAGRTDPLLVSEDVAVACLKELYGPVTSVFQDPREERQYFVGILKYMARAYHDPSRKYDLEKVVTYVKQDSYSPRWLTQEEAKNLVAKKFPTRSADDRADILGKLPAVGGRYDRLAIQRESMMASRQPMSVNAAAIAVARPAQLADLLPAQEKSDIDAAIAQSLAGAQAHASSEARAEVAGKEGADFRRINGVILAIPDQKLIRQLDAVTNVFDKYQTAIKPGFPKSRTRLNIDPDSSTGKVTGYHLTLVNVDFPLDTLTTSQQREVERKFNELVVQIKTDEDLELVFEKFELLAGEPSVAGEKAPSYLAAMFQPNAQLQKIMTAFIETLKKKYKNFDIRIRKDIRYHISLVRMSPVIDVTKMIISIDQLKNYLSGRRVNASWAERMGTIDQKTRAQDARILGQAIAPLEIGENTQFELEVAPREKEPLSREKTQRL